MRKSTKNEPAPPQSDSEFNLLAWLATCASVFSFLFYYRHAEVMLYGDAIAHINIARRVFDSQTPGLLQLGTVWLPLPHLLMIPFLVSTQMWRSGAGGSIPSMAAYVFGVLGIFRLTRGVLSTEGPADRAARVAGWTAALIYAANPNLVYMQSTAMGETLYLAFFIWAVVYFSESRRGAPKALLKGALCLAAACLTRYDGWFLAAMMGVIILLQFSWRAKSQSKPRPSVSAVVSFLLITAAGPVLWLAYNSIVYRNPLEFANGPYSAKAIERKTQSAGNPGHPGSGNPLIAALYFVKAAQDNVAQNGWLQRGWILLGIAGLIASFLSGRRFWRAVPQTSDSASWSPLLFLLVPLPFYALSIAYGGVPIFIPNWWPFTHYNVRYGLQLIPALAVGIAVLVYLALRMEGWNSRARLAGTVGLFAFVMLSYVSVWDTTPICLQEAQTNMRTRNQLQVEVARWLEKLPAGSTLLMYLGDQVGALQRAAVPLKRTINEGNHRVWKQPSDSEGLWERALANPQKYADFVLAFEGDPVWQAVHEKHLREVVDLHVTGQPRAILYRAR